MRAVRGTVRRADKQVEPLPAIGRPSSRQRPLGRRPARPVTPAAARPPDSDALHSPTRGGTSLCAQAASPECQPECASDRGPPEASLSAAPPGLRARGTAAARVAEIPFPVTVASLQPLAVSYHSVALLSAGAPLTASGRPVELNYRLSNNLIRLKIQSPLI